jgi:hypothetical protein
MATNFIFLNDGVFEMSISDQQIPSSPFIPEDNKQFYTLAVHPKSGDIYLSDALDYVQASNIYRYDSSGELIHEFKGGIITGGFFFAE